MTEQPIPGEPIFSPFTVLVDTSEQMPFTFQEFYELSTRQRNKKRAKISHPYIVQCEAKHLSTGDYSLKGLEDIVTIERKSLPDLVSSFTAERERELRKLERMQDESFDFTAYVIEASWPMLIHSNEYTLKIKKSLSRSIIAFQQRYRTQWFFAGSRREAERWTLRSLERFWNDRQEKISH